VVYSGSEAVAVAAGFVPEIVLCDLGLPGMSGYEVALALRRDERLAGARLIALSGYGQEEDRRRSLEAGFDLHLTKPVEPDELRDVLQRPPPPRAS
jgi:CheY-like chemotaxis protein